MSRDPNAKPLAKTPRLPRDWLALGVLALAISGLFSIIVSFAWHPAIRCIALFETLFKRSLVAHVNLSISLWFLCLHFMLSTARTTGSPRVAAALPYVNRSAQTCMVAAILTMSTAALLPDALPQLNNYIPTLYHPLFFVSLGLVTATVVLAGIRGLYTHFLERATPVTTETAALLRTYRITSSGVLVIALAAFIVSFHALSPTAARGEMYFEMLFWGGGHILQYLWVQLMLTAWLWMLATLVPGFSPHREYRALLWLNLLIVAGATPWPFVLHDVASPAFRQLFTSLMAWASGVAPMLAVLLFILHAFEGRHGWRWTCSTPAGAALLWSLLLFAVGGAFGVMIDSINVKIPAHYHGSLIGVTLALMGLTYVALGQHGYRYLENSRMARWQPALLGGGQIAHIVGLFLSGGYGVQRKTPCAGDNRALAEAMQQADLALRLQSTGGGLAILGGLLFVVVCIKAWRRGAEDA